MKPYNSLPLLALLTACTTTPGTQDTPDAPDGKAHVQVTITAPAQMEQHTIRDTLTAASLTATNLLAAPTTRATLTANGTALTDIYILDYNATTGLLLQVLHQTSTAPDFAAPSLALDYGTHTLKVIATRSTAPALMTATATPWSITPNVLTAAPTVDAPAYITAEKTSDTFAATTTLTVTASAGHTAAVTLDRIVAKMVIKSTDIMPQDCSALDIELNEYQQLRCADISVIGHAKNHRISDVSPLAGKPITPIVYYVMCPEEGYTTDITITPTTTSGATYTPVTIPNVPLDRNKVTTITGSIYTHAVTPTLSVNDTWATEGHDINF